MTGTEPERLHTSVLVAPAAERRRLRKQRRQAAARLQAEQRAVEKGALRNRAEAHFARSGCLLFFRRCFLLTSAP